MIRTLPEVSVLSELKEFLVPLAEEEYKQLEQSIQAEGCRDNLIAWERSPTELVLIDGHNRYSICMKNNIPFALTKVSFSDIEEVKEWMIDNQLGRRNLNPDQLSYYRGLKYLTFRKRKGGYENVKSKGKNEPSTSELLAGQFKVSESTIKRDSKFAEGLNIIGKSNPELKTKILKGETKVNKGDIQVLPDAKNASNIVIRNEADLFNKAKVIRNEILDDVESSIQKIENERIEKARESLQSKEPLFLEREDRLTKIKGMILSAINRAINNRDIKAIDELKKLIERLEHELFD